MNQVGMRLSDADVRAMMKEAGVDYNGRIFYEGRTESNWALFFKDLRTLSIKEIVP